MEKVECNEVCMRLSGAYVVYRHEQWFEGCITTTVFDTNLTFQKQIPQVKVLSTCGCPYKTDGECTVLMLITNYRRVSSIKWV